MTNFQSIDAFRPQFNSLARVAYFKIIINEVSIRTRIIHNIYRVVAWFFIVLYNLQHVINVVVHRHNADRIVDTLFILLTTLGTLGKQLAFNLRSHRIEQIIRVIKGPYFAPKRPAHVTAMKDNALMMARLLTLYHIAVYICGTFWTIYPLVNKVNGFDVHLSAYFPYGTNSSPQFEISVAYLSILIIFQAYGNVTMDCMIVSLYAQAILQFKLLRDNLENLLEPEGLKKEHRKKGYSRCFEDLKDPSFGIILQGRLNNHIEHYQKIVWLKKEIENIFSEALFFQFLVNAWVLCMTVYKITDLSLMSVEFVSMAIYLACMLGQFFIYCYIGSILKFESELINNSIFISDWLSLSPRFRRQLIIMMERHSKPMNPKIAGIVNISLETYIAVLKSSYSLFTFLNSQK